MITSHDGERFIGGTLESVLGQTELPSLVVVVDDASADGTVAIIRERARSAPVRFEIIEVDGSPLGDARARIAATVAAGLTAATGHDVVILGDQDDEWLADRVARQRRVLLETDGAVLAAGDGLVVDATGAPTGMTLRAAFPPPPDWTELSPAARMRAVVRRPLVTGSAAAVGRELIPLLAAVPAGWLLDRWASLIAAALGGLVLEREAVIRYRLHPDQTLGFRGSGVGAGRHRWRQLLERGASPVEAAIRARDVVGRIRPLAEDPAIRRELTWRAVLGSALDRA